MNEKIEAATTTGVVATVTAGIEPCDNPATHDLVKWTEMECTAIYEKEPSIVNLPNQTQFEDLGYKLSKKLSESPTENELFLLYKLSIAPLQQFQRWKQLSQPSDIPFMQLVGKLPDAQIGAFATGFFRGLKERGVEIDVKTCEIPGYLMDLNNIPKSLTQKKYRYVYVSHRPHVNQAGQPSVIITWEGRCKKCGAPFTVTTGRFLDRPLNRNCSLHRQRRRSSGHET